MGGCSLNYRRVDTVDLEGTFLTYNDTGNVKALWDQFFDKTQLECQEVTIGDLSLGTGRVLSFSYDTGLDANRKDYSMSLEFTQTGYLFDAAANEFDSDLNTGVVLFQDVADISESFDFSRAGDEYNYSRSLSFSIDTCGDANSIAKSLARLLMSGSPAQSLLLLQYPDYYTASGNRIFSESYDKVKGSYSFRENFRKPAEALQYIFNVEHSLTADALNFTTVEENGFIKSAIREDNTETVFAAQSGGIYDRCLAVFTGWSADMGLSATGCLASYPSSKSISRNQCAKELTYSYVYSTDPTKYSCYSFERGLSISENLGILSVGERGTITYLCGDKADRLDMAKSIYSGETGNIETRILDAFNDYYIGFTCQNTGTPNLTDRSKTYVYPMGQVEYDWNYQNDPSILNSGDIYKLSNDISIGEQTHLYNLFGIVNNSEIAQESAQSNVGTMQNNVSVEGKNGVTIDDMLTAAFGAVQKPTGEYYLADLSYNYSPINTTLTLSANYNFYNRFKEIYDPLLW